MMIVSLLVVSTILAQDVPLPPKPPEGPSLEVTTKFIEEKLNQQGTVNFSLVRHNSLTNEVGNPIRQAVTMFDAHPNPSSCIMSLSRRGELPDGQSLQRYEFSLREVEKLTIGSLSEMTNRSNAEHGSPEFTNEFIPPVFEIILQMQSGKTVTVRKHVTRDGKEPADNQSTEGFLYLYFREEELAQRVAKALVHAVELCGGGSKDPF